MSLKLVPLHPDPTSICRATSITLAPSRQVPLDDADDEGGNSGKAILLLKSR